MEQIYQDYYSIIQEYTARELTFMEDKAAACSSILVAITGTTKSSVHHGILMSDIRRGLLWSSGWRRISWRERTGVLEQWPTWSWLSYPGRVRFRVRSISSPQEEEDVTRLALDDELAQNPSEEQSTSNDKRLCLKGFLIAATIGKKPGSRQSSKSLIFVKDKEVGRAKLDYDKPSTYPVPIQGFLFSLGETRLEKKRRKELRSGSITFQGLVLVRHNETSFKTNWNFHDIRWGKFR
jgi:hypothetical protein